MLGGLAAFSWQYIARDSAPVQLRRRALAGNRVSPRNLFKVLTHNERRNFLIVRHSPGKQCYRAHSTRAQERSESFFITTLSLTDAGLG